MGKCKTALLLLALAIIFSVHGQTYVTPVRSDITPPSPQSSALIEVQTPQPDLLTGAVNVSVPVYTISVDGLSFPVSLQYQSNGIKVFDDPTPLGYGWPLLPALQVNRTVLGRPDEMYEFSGDPQAAEDPTGMLYMCSVYADAPSNTFTERYDSEHDIIDISLPDKTLKRVIDTSGGTPVFIGAGDNEYKVEADSALNTIKVIDPSGICYYFGGIYEGSYDRGGNFIRTSWPLFKIELDNGRTINLQWSQYVHPSAPREWIGGHSFMDKWDLYQWGNSGVSQDSFENDNYAGAVLSRNSETKNFLHLSSIQFPGGSVSFDYDIISQTGPILKSVRIISIAETVKTYTLEYADEKCTLLTKVDGGSGNTFAFDYNTQYGTTPFYTWTGRHAQDWWGYFNDKPNQSLTPKIKVKRYYSTTNTDGSYKQEIGEADRSVDTNAMQALIMTKVTWPTGGTSQFEYEPHSFAPTRMENNNEVAPEYDPYLSVGGGLRVKKITTSAGNAENDMVVRYEYPLATVRSVPSAATFVEVYNTVFPMHDVPAFTDDPVSRMRMVNIMPMSDYMRYDTGVTPLWYDHVTTVWAEGKTETYFKDIHQRSGDKPEIGYGYRKPNNMYHVFDGTPAMTKQVIYRADGSGFVPVETTEFVYAEKLGSNTAMNYNVRRELVYTKDQDLNSPDLIDGYYIEGGPKAYGTYPRVENGYSSMPYAIYPYYKILKSKTHTIHTETGDIATSEQYEYKAGTGLLEKIVTGSSEGKTSTISIEYPDTGNGGVEAAMVSANVVATPMREHLTYGSANVLVSAQYVATGSGAFRQRITAATYGGSSESLYTPTCEYDNLGHIIRATDADGIMTEWGWDNDGLYPILKNQSGHRTTFSYKPLVGLSSITGPFGASTTFDYDSENRLIGTSITGLGKMQDIAYNFVPGENSITTTTWLDNVRKIITTEHFDNLGRKIKSEVVSSGLAQYIRYDNMGRACASSLPSTEAPVSEYDYARTFYEQSPRGVIVSTVKNGSVWQDNGKTVNIRTVTNVATGCLSAPQYRINSNGSVEHLGNYPAAQLLVEEVTDENGHVTRKYTNKSGLVVMSEEGDGASDMLRTRSIYDDYGRLRYILTPAFSDGDFAKTDDSFIKNCYEIRYDELGRQNYVRMPGATAAKRTVYSAGGRIIAERTAMSSADWFLHFYDKFGRESYTSRSAGISDIQLDYLTEDFSLAEFVGTGDYSQTAGYRLTPVPRCQVNNAYAASYYDNYNFLEQSNSLTGTRPVADRTSLQTGGYDAVTGLYALIYDDYGRLTERHEWVGATNKLSMTYTVDRAGNPLSTSEQLSSAGSGTKTITTDFSYDETGRLKAWNTVFGAKKASAEMTYDKLGKVATEKFGNNVKRAYTYDCHGWIKKIVTSDPKFLQVGPIGPITLTNSVSNDFYSNALGLDIGGSSGLIIKDQYTDYTEEIMYENGAIPRYDGTASAHCSTLGGQYDYTFDCHDRLVNASYHNINNFKENFSVEYTYNEVGAPLSVKRMGINAISQQGNSVSEAFGILDNMTYDWDGMLLSSISATANGYDYYGRVGYQLSATGGTGTYTWNEGGMLRSDSARGITDIEYHPMGQPQKVTFADGGYLYYTYRSDGTLASVKTYSVLPGASKPTQVSARSYCGNFVFENDSLTTVNFSGGYFDGKGAPHYRHADFQGNITIVTDQDGDIEQHTGYYPYGEPWREPDGQPYLYGSKERMRDNGLNYYDFRARRLNAAICLWSTPDPLALDYSALSPYSSCAANPVRFIDPSGKDVIATSEESKLAILNTLPCEVWEYVVFDENGQINKDALNVCTVESYNLKSLKELVNSDETVIIDVGNIYFYMNSDGYYEEEKFAELIPDEFKPAGDELYGFMPTTGEQGHGGKTVFNTVSETYNSIDSSIYVFINGNFSPEGQAQMFSHEAYGHAYLYIKDPSHPEKARHVPIFENGEWHDSNKELSNRIVQSMYETHANYTRKRSIKHSIK